MRRRILEIDRDESSIVVACVRTSGRLVFPETVLACHVCKQSPCVLVPAPAPKFECVTEMVPFTVMKTKTRVDLVPVCTRTIMKTKLETVYDEQGTERLQARVRHGF